MSPAMPGRSAQRGRDTSPAPDTRAVSPERITVALIPKATADLQRLQERTGLSKTDITNRSISLYEFIDAQLRAGKEVLIREPETGQTQIVHIFL